MWRRGPRTGHSMTSLSWYKGNRCIFFLWLLWLQPWTIIWVTLSIGSKLSTVVFLNAVLRVVLVYIFAPSQLSTLFTTRCLVFSGLTSCPHALGWKNIYLTCDRSWQFHCQRQHHVLPRVRPERCLFHFHMSVDWLPRPKVSVGP